MHSVAKEYSYGTRFSQLMKCCPDEGCPQVKPQIDLNGTRVAAQHTLIGAGAQPSKKQKVDGGDLVGGGGGAINQVDLDWDDDEETVAVMSLAEQLEAEFSQVWHTWMKEVKVPWPLLFPEAPQAVQQGDETDLENLEDWLTLDMRRVFMWLSGNSQCITHKEATGSTPAHKVTAAGFKGKLGYIVAMAFAFTGDNLGSSFCERINSDAKNVMTEGRTLLDPTELEMVVVLRINRDFMEYMKLKHPQLVTEFQEKAAVAAAAAAAK
jgi:hypothetical protein